MTSQQYDDEAILAAEAFSFGLGGLYVAARQAEIERQIRERYPNTPSGIPRAGGGTGGGLVDNSPVGGGAEPPPDVG